MEQLTKAALEDLINNNSTPAVTIYIPMHTTASPPHISENQIRFKNMVNKALDQLSAHGTEHDLAKALRNQLDNLHDDLSFWEQQSPGLLICASPKKISMFQLPIDTEEYLSIDQQYHLAPVMGLLHDAREFYLLTLAQHNPRFFKGSLYGLEETRINFPASPKIALNIDEPNQKSENQGTATGPSTQGKAGSPGNRTGWFNGRGGSRNPQEADRLRYFRIIDKTICDQTERDLPLLLSGIESEIAEYRSISKHPQLMIATITGNHTNDNLQSLFNTAQAIVWQELVMPEHRLAIDEYQQISGANPGRIAKDSHSIMQAAEQGRIDKLLAIMSRRTTDTVRDHARQVPRLTFPSKDESKRLNNVALTVWQTSGTVYNLQPEEMPESSLMTARLRY